MKKIVIVTFSLLALLVLYLYFFLPIPSFSDEEVVKRIEDGVIILEWKQVVGVVDQNFPDVITLRKGPDVDTICISHNIADLELHKKRIKIYFYGKPIKYNNKAILPQHSFGYRIEIVVVSQAVQTYGNVSD